MYGPGTLIGRIKGVNRELSEFSGIYAAVIGTIGRIKRVSCDFVDLRVGFRGLISNNLDFPRIFRGLCGLNMKYWSD